MTSTERTGHDSYYGRPILKEPVWKSEVGWYLFTGGLAGASASLSLAARLAGNRSLARTSSLVAAAAVNVSPLLLVKDLGRPERFLNMLRVFKPTSPMSVGSWLLAATGTAQSAATTCELLDVLPRVGGGAQACSGLLGPALATYTGALLSDTAVPVWHEARRELPAVFAASSCASAGAAATLVGDVRTTGPARRLAVLGAAAELVATGIMERRLGVLGEPYRQDRAGRYARVAKPATAAGLAVTALGRGRLRRAGAVLILGGAVLQRFAIFEAGKASARDPRYTLALQRQHVG
jgi:Polysulphide reductase, NrfD